MSELYKRIKDVSNCVKSTVYNLQYELNKEEREIANIEIEANYKAEVVTKSNEEEILRLHEQALKLENDRDDATAVIEDEIKKEEKASEKKSDSSTNYNKEKDDLEEELVKAMKELESQNDDLAKEHNDLKNKVR